MSWPIALNHQVIHLDNLYTYNALLRIAHLRQEKHRKLIESVDKLLDRYAKEHPELLAKLSRLKLDLRLLTKGTPVTEPMDSASSQPILRSDPNFNEQQHNAHSEICKKAYRKVAMLAHPDRGGNEDDFADMEAAYADRDIARLIGIFIRLSHGANLYWQQSEEGLSYASTEVERTGVLESLLKSNPAFEIVRYHMAGSPWRAEAAMAVHLESEIQKLETEINYIKAQHEKARHEKLEKLLNKIQEGGEACCEGNESEGRGSSEGVIAT